MKKICITCKKEYIKNPKIDFEQWDKSRFCSRECFLRSRWGGRPRTGINKNCSLCKKDMFVELNQIQHGKGKYCSMTCYNLSKRGSRMGKNHPRWKGGSGERHMAMGQIEYVLWRTAVFTRDNYTCQLCGIKNKKGLGKTVKIEADHIKPWALYPELRYAIDNGRTLCRPCHLKTETFGGRKFLQAG